MLSFTVKLVLTVAALVVLEIVRRLWAQSHKLKHLKTVARDNFFSGSRFRFFGRGRDSQNLVLQTSKQFNYEPWVVPGGLFSTPFVVVSTYESARHILNNHTHKGGAARALYYPGTPRTIVTAEGEEWKAHRNLLAPVFTATNMRAAVPAVDAVARQVVQYLDSLVAAAAAAAAAGAAAGTGKPATAAVEVDIHSLAERYALDVVGAILLGKTFGAVSDPTNKAHSGAHRLSMYSGQLYASPLRRYLRLGRAEYKEAERDLLSVAQDVLADHVSGKKKNGLFQLLEDAKVKGTNAPLLTPEQRMELLLLAINAAHDPGMPISFALYELAQPSARHILEHVRKEVDAVVPPPAAARRTTTTWRGKQQQQQQESASDGSHEDDDGGDRLTPKDIDSMPWVRAVFLEALRKWPISGIGTARFLETDDEIELPDDKAGSSKQKKKTVKIPAGTFVMIPFYTLSRSQEAWGADPEQFNPQRFVPPPESAASGAAAGAAGKKKSKSSSDSAAAEEEDVEEEEKFGDAQFQANMDNVKINFSGGNRACPGFYMSINESVLFLARVLRAFDIALPAPSPAAAASSSSSSAAAAKDGNAAQKASSAAAAGGVELDCGIHLMPKEIKLVLTPRN